MQTEVPAAKTFKFRCDDCRQKLKVDRDCCGKWTICPHCNEIIQIPQIKVASAVAIEDTYHNISGEDLQSITGVDADSNTTSQAVQTFLKDTRTDGIPAEDVAWSAPVVDNSEEENDDELLVSKSHAAVQADTAADSSFEDETVENVAAPKGKSLKVKGKTAINVGGAMKTKIKVNAKGKPKAKKFKKVSR